MWFLVCNETTLLVMSSEISLAFETAAWIDRYSNKKAFRERQDHSAQRLQNIQLVAISCPELGNYNSRTSANNLA